jgi:hypothetical protein
MEVITANFDDAKGIPPSGLWGGKVVEPKFVALVKYVPQLPVPVGRIVCQPMKRVSAARGRR